MKDKFLDTFILFSNKFFGTNYLLSYEKQYLEELHQAITFASATDEAFVLKGPARYRVD